MAEIPTLALNDGTNIPAVAFGTYLLKGDDGIAAIESALQTGYRHLDSAFNYENEGTVGAAIRRSAIPRDEIRIASKLPGRHHAYKSALTTVEESVLRTGLDHIDIYLIHWPNPKQGHYVEAWQALIEAQKRGLVRTIGVCNFLPAHLDRLIAETGVTPAINQIELHPYFPQTEQREADRARGIVTQAWSPLGRAGTLREDEKLVAIAKRLDRSVSQVILRWHVELGVQPLPKASGLERQRENISLFDFDLSPADLETIASLARTNGRLEGQDPASYEEF